MKLIFGLIIWTLQIIFLFAVAIFNTIGQLFSSVSSTTQGHLNENAERGKTFVRAYYYLEALESGGADSPESANGGVAASNGFEAKNRRASVWIDQTLDGPSRLPNPPPLKCPRRVQFNRPRIQHPPRNHFGWCGRPDKGRAGMMCLFAHCRYCRFLAIEAVLTTAFPHSLDRLLDTLGPPKNDRFWKAIRTLL